MDVEEEAFLVAVRAVSRFYSLRGDAGAAVVYRRAQHVRTMAEHGRYVAGALDRPDLPEPLRELLEDAPIEEPTL